MEEHRIRAHAAWRRAERIRQISDRLVGVGPFGLGIDGIIAWVPVAGTAYSVGAAALLIHEAVSAGASRATLVKMAAYLSFDSATSAIPIVGWAVDTLFPGHALAARSLQRDIEKRHGRPVEEVTPSTKGRQSRANVADDVAPQRLGRGRAPAP